jgi:polyisoprenoid-binding protein YceI
MATTQTQPSIVVPEPGTYTIDPSHSAVAFTARHMMVSKVRGRFGVNGGHIIVDPQPEKSSVHAEIDAASVNSGDEKRDEHLRSADFFDTENHPTVLFHSTKVDDNKDGSFTLYGDLTLKGVTKPVTLEGEYLGSQASPWNDTRVGFSARTQLNRKDWGIDFNAVLETGGVVVGDKITLDVDIEAIKQ